jgi:hypothetical protein
VGTSNFALGVVLLSCSIIALLLLDADVTLNGEDAVLAAATTLLTWACTCRSAMRVGSRCGPANHETELVPLAQTAGDALKGAGYDVESEDVVIPTRTNSVTNGIVFGLATIRDVKQSQDTPIPYATVY